MIEVGGRRGRKHGHGGHRGCNIVRVRSIQLKGVADQSEANTMFIGWYSGVREYGQSRSQVRREERQLSHLVVSALRKSFFHDRS